MSDNSSPFAMPKQRVVDPAMKAFRAMVATPEAQMAVFEASPDAQARLLTHSLAVSGILPKLVR